MHQTAGARDARCTIVQATSGLMVDLADPRPDQIHLEDIARGLARLPRFSGQGAYDGHYSVAEHSIMVAEMVPPPYRPWALVHDGAEAYMGGDLVSPVKYLCPELKRIERGLLLAIAYKFKLKGIEPPSVVKEADRRVMAAERIQLGLDGVSWPILEGVEPAPIRLGLMSARNAEMMWLDCWRALSAELAA